MSDESKLYTMSEQRITQQATAPSSPSPLSEDQLSTGQKKRSTTLDQSMLTDPRSDIMDVFQTHSLKVVPPYWQAVYNDHKTFEVRKNDRGFQRGDLLRLHEWHVSRPGDDDCGSCYNARLSGKDGHYTGSQCLRWIAFVYAGDPRFGGIEPGYVVLALVNQRPDWTAGAS